MGRHNCKMLRSICAVVCFLMVFSACQTDKKRNNCEDFQTGKFKYEDPQFSGWDVTRTKTKQTERHDSLGIVIESEVKWISECEYLLIYKAEGSSTAYSKLIDTLTVELTEVKNNSYSYHAFNNNSDSNGVMVLVE